ncbi:MAG: hypothetical protein RI967_2670 [Planctomycetota bacterium]
MPTPNPHARALPAMPPRAASALRLLARAAISLVGASVASLASAHFPFVVPSSDGATAVLIMSETLVPDDGVELGLLAPARLVLRTADGATFPLASPRADHEGDTFSLALPGSGTRVVAGTADLGVMQRGQSPAHLLVYHPKTVIGDPFAPSTVLGGSAPIEFVAEVGNHCYHLRLLVEGKAMPDAEMHLIHEDGRDEIVRTDAEGRTPPLMPGRIAAWARHWVDEAGERDGRAYAQVRHYATYVADLPDPHGMRKAPVARGGADADAPTAGELTLEAKPIGPVGIAIGALPRPVASFGAATLDGWLYIYGGHRGTRHDYSTATVSGRLSRARIAELVAGTAVWEELAGGPPAQGLNLVAHGGRIIRVGGMEPRNAPGEPADNHSLAEVAAFDPATRTWQSLPPLPEGRSSHDVVSAGGMLVVVGGWNMQGSRAATEWPAETLLLDPSNPDAGWTPIPQPFRRRALIAAAAGDEVFVIGGFDEDDRAHVEVDVLHVPTRTWSKAPALPVDARAGFAPAAAVFEGRVYASVASGELFLLDEARTAWQPVARTTPRIVHRMVADADGLLVLGGARDADMTDLVERVTLRAGAAAPKPVADGGVRAPRTIAPAKSWTHPDGSAFIRAMSAIDDSFDALSAARDAKWTARTDREGLRSPREEAAHLASLLDSVRGREAGAPEPFVAMLATGRASAARLRDALARAEEDGANADHAALDAALASLSASCRDCHRQYR